MGIGYDSNYSLNSWPVEAGVSEAVGGPYYIEHHPVMAIGYTVITCILVVLGCLGNSLILATVFFYKVLRHRRNTFVVNLAIADLTIASFADPMSIIGMVVGKPYFDARPGLCDVISTVCVTACVAALFSIGGVGFSQYLSICQTEMYLKIFTLRNSIILSVAFWLLGLLVSVPTVLGWTNNIYDPKYLECIWNRQYSLSFNIVFSVGVVATPVVVIGVSYIKIFLRVRESRRQVGAEGEGAGKNSGAGSSIKLARMLSLVFVGFVVCWFPYATIVVADWKDRVGLESHLYVLLLAHCHSSINFVIYAATNVHFRRGYVVVLCKMVCRTPPSAINLSDVSETRVMKPKTAPVDKLPPGRLLSAAIKNERHLVKVPENEITVWRVA